MRQVNDRFGQPLLSYEAYDKKEQATNTAIDLENERYYKAVEEDMRLTARLLGRDEAAPIVSNKLPPEQAAPLLDSLKDLDRKGLRQRLKEEQIKHANVLVEIEFLKPLLVNNTVEGQLILKRTKALEERVKELERIGVVVAP
jgi:hypothetical protein